MRNDDVRMVLGAMQDFRENRIANKRWAEKQILDAEMRKRDEERYADQKRLAEAMAARDERRLNHQIGYADKQFNYQANRDAVNDRRADDHYVRTGNWRSEDVADRRSAAAHGQKMDADRHALNQLEYELRKQQLENQPNSTATYGWGADEEGNPTFGPQSYTTSFRSNGDSIRVPQGAAPNQSAPATPPTAAQPAAAASSAQRAAPEPTSFSAPATGGYGPLTEPTDLGLMPNPKANGFYRSPNTGDFLQYANGGSLDNKNSKGLGDDLLDALGLPNSQIRKANKETKKRLSEAARIGRLRQQAEKGNSGVRYANPAAAERMLRKAAEEFDAQAQH